MTTRAPTSALAVANAFLDIQDADDSTFPPIDQLKMQKLVFYAHGWWLAIKGSPLFCEEVYAWPWGPVVPNVYGEFKSFGAKPIIGYRATELVKVGPTPLDFKLRPPPAPTGEVPDCLAAVWKVHKKFTGTQLSNATHGPGEPWTIVKERYGGDLGVNPVIPNDLIKEVFKKKLDAYRVSKK